MLVLSRKKNEVVNVGKDVVVKIVKISHGRVHLGIEAPQNVRILRAEAPRETPGEAA